MINSGRRGMLSRLVAVLAVVAVLTGCSGAADAGRSADSSPVTSGSGAAPTAPVATPAVPGMRAQAVRLRTDAAVGGQIQTRITNTGAEPFLVLGVSLDSPGFERLPFAGRSADYNPGARIDLPTAYGAAICAAGVRVDPVFTALQVQRPDGRTEEVQVPLEAPDDIVDRIHTEECQALALAAAVGVRLGVLTPGALDARPVLQADITLTRGESTENIELIELIELRGSVVFDVSFAQGGDSPLALAADASELAVPVVIRMTGRGCDAHVLGETKQPFLFPYFLAFDAGEPQYAVLDVSPEQRDALWSYVDLACADA